MKNTKNDYVGLFGIVLTISAIVWAMYKMRN